MSTRSFADFEFDHGAQFFTARSNKFNEFLLPYLEDRTVVEWKPKILTLEKGKDPFGKLMVRTTLHISTKNDELMQGHSFIQRHQVQNPH